MRISDWSSDVCSSDLGLDRSLLKLSPLTFYMAGGFFSSHIELNARRRPVQTRYDIRLAPPRMGRLLSRWGAVTATTTGQLKARAELPGERASVRAPLASYLGRIARIMTAGTFWIRNN